MLRALGAWWQATARRDGATSACRQLAEALWEFARDSTPERKRSRYGDADYDWDHRVNTTSGGLGWRERLLGTLHSPYQPTEPDLFHTMIADWIEKTGADPRAFCFCDLGSGKGRTLLMASDYPFNHIVGVELLPSLHAEAQQNLGKYKGDSQQCFSLNSVCADATMFPLPAEPLLLYLFNPFPEAGMRRVMENVKVRLGQPAPLYVLYHNPLFEHLLAQGAGLSKLGGTHQYTLLAVDSDQK